MDIKKGREVAFKKNIGQLLQESLVIENADPNMKLFARVNLIAIILEKEKKGTITNLLLDDGSGRIVVRCFEENKIIETLKVGENILVIGRVRGYGGGVYVSPEIMRKTSPQWLKLRALELERSTSSMETQEKWEKISAEEELFPRQKIIQTIKLLDVGEGVMIEEVIEKTHLADMKRWVTLLLEQGDIYQIRPGRVKVL